MVLTGDAGVSRALSAHIEQDHAVVQFVTLSCAGSCADVEAVATGGNPPYSYRWEDGSTSTTRHVCPTASTSYEVAATDTAVSSGEFPRPSQVARAALTANVLACPADAGAVDAQTDGGAGGTLHPTGCAPVTIPLSSCSTGAGTIDPLQGITLTRGESRALRITGTGSFVASQPWHYELWGSKDGCSMDEKLAAFQLANGPFDLSYCVAASQDYPYTLLYYRISPGDGLSLSNWSVSWCSSCGN
jgi:hypothetical protein